MQAWNAHFTYGNYFVDRIKTESILLCKTAAKYVAASILNAEEVGNALRSERGGRFADIDEVLPADEIPEDLELPEEEPTLEEWGESKHPRKDNGQFGTGSGEHKKTTANFSEKNLEQQEKHIFTARGKKQKP